MPSPELDRAIDRMEELRLCSPKEADRVYGPEWVSEALGRQSGCRPPQDYVDYLTWAGDTRAVLYGMSLSPREADSAKETAEELEEDHPALDADNRFFISEQQGYIVWYFKPEDPAVYRYMEGDDEESTVAGSFAAFLNTIIDRAVENRRMHEERTR